MSRKKGQCSGSGSPSYRAGFCTLFGEIRLLLHTTPITVLCCPSSHPSHPVPFEAAEAGADQRLPADGGGVHSQPGADEAPGGETGGQTLSATSGLFFVPGYCG